MGAPPLLAIDALIIKTFELAGGVAPLEAIGPTLLRHTGVKLRRRMLVRGVYGLVGSGHLKPLTDCRFPLTRQEEQFLLTDRGLRALDATLAYHHLAIRRLTALNWDRRYFH